MEHEAIIHIIKNRFHYDANNSQCINSMVDMATGLIKTYRLYRTAKNHADSIFNAVFPT